MYRRSKSAGRRSLPASGQAPTVATAGCANRYVALYSKNKSLGSSFSPFSLIACRSSTPLSKCRLFIRAKDFSQHVADFSQGSVSAHALQNIRHQVSVGRGGCAQGFEGRPNPGLIARGAHALEFFALVSRYGLVDDQERDGAILGGDVIIDPDDGFLLPFDGLLIGVGGVVDLLLRVAAFEAGTMPPMASIFWK